MVSDCVVIFADNVNADFLSNWAFLVATQADKSQQV
jgi:hypothetical protein